MTKEQDALEAALRELESAPHECFKYITVEDEGIIIDGAELVPILAAAKAFLAILPRLDKICEAREKATEGEWYKVGLPWNSHSPYIIAGHHDPHVGKAIIDVIEQDAYEGVDDEDIERQQNQDEHEQETNCDFITTAANEIAAINKIRKGE